MMDLLLGNIIWGGVSHNYINFTNIEYNIAFKC